MRGRPWLTVFLGITAIGLIVYAVTAIQDPSGLERMGENDLEIAKYGLWAAIAGALASFFSLLKEFLGLFKRNGRG